MAILAPILLVLAAVSAAVAYWLNPRASLDNGSFYLLIGLWLAAGAFGAAGIALLLAVLVG